MSKNQNQNLDFDNAREWVSTKRPASLRSFSSTFLLKLSPALVAHLPLTTTTVTVTVIPIGGWRGLVMAVHTTLNPK